MTQAGPEELQCPGQQHSERTTMATPALQEQREGTPVQTTAEVWGRPFSVTQPGGGLGWRLEVGWARARRWFLRRFRRGYVERMQRLRAGECPGCNHDVIDSRDLKFVRNACGFWFPSDVDPFAWRDQLPVARDGWAEICLFGGPLLAVGLVLVRLAPLYAALPFLALAAVVAFFRNPRRSVPSAPGIMVAPADGKVTDVTEVEEMPLAGGPAIRIGIFLSVFDVHVNRCPERGLVVDARYRPGRFLDARNPRAGSENESTTIWFRNERLPGADFVVRQVAGAVARRIVCYAGPGKNFDRGQLIGLIKFGSRTELYVRKDDRIEVCVRPGDRVYGGTSPIVHYVEEDVASAKAERG